MKFAFVPPHDGTEPLDEVIATFLEAERVGRAPRTDALLANYPALAAELRTFLDDRQCFTRAASSITAGPASAWSAGPLGAAGQPATPMPSRVGNYEILGELGRGGMGVVYKARQLALKRAVALKMVLDGVHLGGPALARFRSEAEAVARLQHPNIVPIYEVGAWEGRPFFSLEFVDGGTLAQRINGAPQPTRQAAAIVETLARAMDYAHRQGIVHRDLKPANVLLTSQGMPKITDFGLAKHVERSDGDTKTGAILGTPSYIAPEQASGKKSVGPAADIYALGVILYEMLTGRPPFRGESPMETMLQVMSDEVVPPSRHSARVSRDLETICLKCLQKEPAKRYPSAHALADDLRHFLAGESITARPVSGIERGWRWCRRKPLAAGLMAAALLFFVGGVGGVFWQWRVAEANLDEAKRQRQLSDKNYAEAQRERDRADENLRDAHQVVDEFLVKMSDEGSRGLPGFEPLMHSFLLKAIHHYQGFLRRHAGDPKVKSALGETHYKVGVIQSNMERYEDALASFQSALALQQELANVEPADFKRKRALATTHRGIAGCYIILGRTADAQRSLAAARSLLLEISIAEPLGRWQEDLALIHEGLGSLHLEAARHPLALAEFEAARALMETLLKVEPTRNHLYKQAGFHTLAGSMYLRLGKPAKSQVCYEEGLKIIEPMLKETPWQLNLLRLRAHLIGNLASLRHMAGDNAAALTLLSDTRETAQLLVSLNPKGFQNRLDLAFALHNIGKVRFELGSFDDALSAFNASIDLGEKLMLELPRGPQYRDRFAATYELRCRTLQAKGQTADAQRDFDRARALLEKLVKEQPDNRDYREQMVGLDQRVKQAPPRR